METTSIWLGNSSRPVSTLCDGWPRAPGSGLSYVSSMVTRKVYNPPSYTGPTPTCRYNYHGCELMVLSYLEEYSRVESISTATRPRSPACVMDMSQCLMPVGDFGCRLDAGHVRLLYWAQSKDPSALCVNNTHPVTSPPPTTEPVTAVYDGHTLTSPTVYLSFDHLEGNLCFSEYSNTIIGVPSNSISSIRFASKAYLSRTLSMNWADLEYPVPASAYTGMMDCWTSAWDGKHKDNCATSYDEDYLPHLALPTDGALYKGLDPAFANCSSVSWRKYVLDPPQSMKRADHL
ncbi:uncharacterized protein K452DRAFT_322397 [Aplosporella prunicola CBS 121167]|uniref:Uncharacterized protein n=1 Tax=Aplosporella prunicola CBS 121167 TaxID=1176127 RepID=A0A6A6AZ21_9PEZI|nr:uncharacterized protein K452DRAFT_322397 [Aplosporella prunicola CBS 121167]KAF2136518.1 hypothetical protein K452DRAFT_322397 [Aplosporella prunicola CBS 121167]